jgi:hypothetical protein
MSSPALRSKKFPYLLLLEGTVLVSLLLLLVFPRGKEFRPLLSCDLRELRKITLIRNDEALTFVRSRPATDREEIPLDGAPWTGEGGESVNQRSIDALMGALAEAAVAPNEVKGAIERFGLDQPRLIVQLETETSKQHIAFGVPNETLSLTYARLDDRLDVVLVSGQVAQIGLLPRADFTAQSPVHAAVETPTAQELP